MKRQSSIVFILCMKLLVALVVHSASATNNVKYPDWSGLFLPTWIEDKNKLKYPDFSHYFIPDNNYILISNWKDKLILQSRIFSKKPRKFGYFDNEFKDPKSFSQILKEGNCNIDLKLKDNNLYVKMNNKQKCDQNINISGEYIKYNLEKFLNDRGELFLGKFYNQDICDKATQLDWNEKDLIWSEDEELKEFVDEAKKRNLQCNVNKGFRSYVLACLWGKPQLPEYCEELKDIRGPYKTEELCKKRVYEIVDEMPSHRPHMQPRGYRCEKM